MCTQPVPVSMVTKSAVRMIEVRGRNGCCAPTALELCCREMSCIGSPAGSQPVAAQNCFDERRREDERFGRAAFREFARRRRALSDAPRWRDLPGRVHGVVVQMTMLALPASRPVAIGNFT